VFENRVLRRVFGPKRDEVTGNGENYIMRSFVASEAGGLLWRKVERSKSLVLLQVGGLTCRWSRHSVKTFVLRMLNDS
jgi:hypothetical protein